MPTPSFWDAIGQALLAGTSEARRTQDIKRQLALEQQARGDRLSQQGIENSFTRERLNNEQTRLGGETQDRNMRILNAAIEGANPDQELPQDVVDLANSLHQGGRLEKRQVGGPKSFALDANPNLPGTAVTSLSNPASRTGIFAHQNPKDALEDVKAKIAMSLVPDFVPQGTDVTSQATAIPNGKPAPPLSQADLTKRRGAAAVAFGSATANQMYPDNPMAGGLTGDELLKTLSPQEAIAVKQMANYEFPVPATGRPNNAILRLMSLASAYDPSFDPSQYQIRQGVKKSFTSGKDKDNIVSLNTAIAHLGTMSNKAQALQNSDVPALNWVKNEFGQYVQGKGEVPGFMQAAHAVAGEMSKVFKGTGGTDQEIKDWEKGLSPNMSPDAQAAAINSLVDLLKGRMGVLKSTYENGMGKSSNFSFLNDESKATLKQLGFNPDALDPNAGQPILEGVGGSKQPAPPKDNKGKPATASGAGGGGLDKTMTVLELNRRAKQMGMTPVALGNQLKASGWNIVGE